MVRLLPHGQDEVEFDNAEHSDPRARCNVSGVVGIDVLDGQVRGREAESWSGMPRT